MLHPENFLNLAIYKSDGLGDDVALCAGFERGKWRNDQFADHVIEWLPEFALNHSDLMEIGHQNAIKMMKKAARIVYETEKYGLRGEFGEILLHIAIRQIYDTIPAISKVFYKSATNETVKGFDAIHVVKVDDHLELWIGETKFYEDVNRAISDVAKEIVSHLETDYLRSEFLLIKNKIDPSWPEAEKLKLLLDPNTSLDDVFAKACIPVLLTYDSQIVNNTVKADAEYLDNLKKEVGKSFEKMRTKLEEAYNAHFGESLPITLHVILMPLKAKKEFVASLDKKLKALQA